MNTTLLVLAAGMGSRYGGLKQMDPMGPNGETVLDYSVFDAVRAGFTRVIFVIRKDFADDFKAKIGDKFSDKIEVLYAYQDLNDLPEGFSLPEDRTKPWGTTHAILAARELIDSPFAVINADDFYGADAYQRIADYFNSHYTDDSGTLASHTNKNSAKEHFCMVGYHLSNTLSEHGHVNRGICSTENGFLIDVEEHTEIQIDGDGTCRGNNLTSQRVDISPDAIVSMNFWGFTPKLMLHLEEHFINFLKERGSEMKSECYIPTVVDDLIKAGLADCKALKTSSSWFGVTYPDDKQVCVESLEALISKGAYPRQLTL